MTDLSLLLYSSRTCRCPWQLFSDPVLWSRRLGKKIRLVPCAINFVRGQLREPTAPLHKVDSNHVWHAWEIEHNGWIQHNSSVRVCCQTKVVHPACSYEALIFGFHRELLISPPLGLHMEATKQIFRSHLYSFRVEIQCALESAATTLH